MQKHKRLYGFLTSIVNSSYRQTTECQCRRPRPGRWIHQQETLSMIVTQRKSTILVELSKRLGSTSGMPFHELLFLVYFRLGFACLQQHSLTKLCGLPYPVGARL